MGGQAQHPVVEVFLILVAGIVSGLVHKVLAPHHLQHQRVAGQHLPELPPHVDLVPDYV